MKYLKYILGIVLLLAVAFFAIGFFIPSIYYESEIVVNKPAKEVWAVMSDETKLAEWLDGFQKTELISGTPNTVGAVSKIYFERDGEETILEETITQFKPDELLGMRFTADFMDMDYEMLVEEVDGKSKVFSKTTTIGNGLFAKSMVAMMKGAMKAEEDKNMKNLKRVIEENTKRYFPEVQVEQVQSAELN